jgi:hypothetical protein
VIRKATMTEWGPCLKGVNPETSLLNVKSDLGEAMTPLEERERLLPGYDPAQITRAKALTAGNPQPNSTTDPAPEAGPVVDEEAAARTRKALLDLHCSV